MELDYPTIKNHKITQQINHLDKLGRSILLSLRDIPASDCINKKIKERVLKAISKDDSSALNRIIAEQVIRFQVTVGSKGSNWNILHFCVKSDAAECVQYVLKKQFQQISEQYVKLVNTRTVEGYTPIIIAIIHRANHALQKLLNFGGVDLHIRDEHKMSPYEIALNYKNDTAIRLLMNYEALTKKKLYINRESLRQPILFPYSKSILKNYMDALLCCITLGFFQPSLEQGDNNHKVVSFLSQNTQFVDFVHIGSKKQLPGYDIEWQKASQIVHGYKIPLFDSFNPFEIREPNFTIQNNLIIFQCLSQQPWLLRKMIKADRKKSGYYHVHLYPKKTHEVIYIDEHIPYLKERKEVMFLSDQTEIWPLILQKALAKYYGAYFAINNASPLEHLTQITGFPTIQKNLSDFKDIQLINFLHQISRKNFLLVLKGKKGSQLSQSENSIDCFTVLNYYEKSNQNLVLLNCPFVSQSWKIKQKNQPLALKLIKGHYNTHNQMCVWVNQDDLRKYFQTLIISLTFTNYERIQMRFKAGKILFFKMKIESLRDQPVVLQLVNQDRNSIEDISNIQILKNEGQQQIAPSTHSLKIPLKTIQIQSKPGQYMCYIQLDCSEQISNINYLLLCYSIDGIQPEFIEQQFGILEWFGYIRSYFLKITEKCIVQTVGAYSLIILREQAVNQVELICQTTDQQMVEGTRINNQKVELIKDGHIHYCVIKKQIKPENIVFNYK